MNALPAVQPQPIVLQPLPPPNPALAQPDWNALSGALHVIATEAANIPHSNPAQQIAAMNGNMVAIVAAFNQLQQQIAANHNDLITRLDLAPMRAHNAAASTSGVLQYPPGIVVAPNGPLPVSMSDALELNAPQYFTAINTLIQAGAPGLAPIANNTTLPVKRHHFLDYLGIYL